MEHSSRHLRFKLQSLSRRLDDLEEATRNLQKAEDEVLDLQDKIIQTEGSNSSMLAEVEGLRKRVLKIEGKDEEVKKAEDLCRLIKEKLENEENITRELRLEIEALQKRMSELEKLEEAFSKSKSDCSQLCLSLNEEKNMSKKLSSELELLRTRVKELEASESRLDKTEQLLISELDKIKSLTFSFANERKRFLEREKQTEKVILELREQLEVKEKMAVEQTRNESNLLERPSDQHGERNNSFRIEDTLTSKTSQRLGYDYIKQSEIQTHSENEKNKHQEDNKIKELNQEIEKLQNRLKHFENVEEELKEVKEKNCELQENLISEQNKNKLLTDELQTLKNQATQFREVENGVLDSDDLSRNQIKNERTKNKVTSTEPPISKYTSRDVSPQHLRNERSRNSDSLYKRQLSNSSSSSRKSSRSPLNDIPAGNLRKQEDKLSLSSYSSSGKDVGSTQNELRKSKDQPSVLSRYPPAVQEQTSQKSWKTSTGKQTDRSIKMFGEDYSSKINSKKEILENVENKERPFEDFSENPITTKVQEEIVPVEICAVTATQNSELVNHTPDPNITQNGNFIVENESKPSVNSENIEVKPSTRNRFSKYSSTSAGDENFANNNNEQNESKQKTFISNKEEVEPQSTSNTHRSFHTRDKTRAKSSKPLIPEKPHILESFDYKEPERRARLSGLHTRRQSSPKEKNTLQENSRTSSFENHMPSFQREVAIESFICTSSSADGLENTEINSHTTRTRSCSPRESLQSTMIIKPIIIEKDLKESMSDFRARSSSESSRSQVNVTPSKVTTSIKIYPSEAISSRTDEPTRERHTSTSNIRLSASDQSVLKNNISIPFEISLNKEDMVFKVSNTDNTLDHKEITKAADYRLGREQVKVTDNVLESEPVTWKSHRFETNHIDSKRGTAGSSWRKGVYGSTEELDRIDKDFPETKSRRRSCFDEEKPVRIRNLDHYSRNKSVSSWSSTAPEFVSKRSQSTLTATEIVSRRNLLSDSLSSGYTSWSRSSVEVDDSFSSRRKYTSERLAKTDSSGWRQTQKPRQRGMVEERIRQLEH
ncbi:leucine zipper protein 1 [Pyxicephalus adspersus]|uniref:leucine zipper protein 1 n=1 Tax=Pyxicephalus adspersus TaxID=30357 RepID=UPI003B5B4CB1